jgi:hypothetical protein
MANIRKTRKNGKNGNTRKNGKNGNTRKNGKTRKMNIKRKGGAGQWKADKESGGWLTNNYKGQTYRDMFGEHLAPRNMKYPYWIPYGGNDVNGVPYENLWVVPQVNVRGGHDLIYYYAGNFIDVKTPTVTYGRDELSADNPPRDFNAWKQQLTHLNLYHGPPLPPSYYGESRTGPGPAINAQRGMTSLPGHDEGFARGSYTPAGNAGRKTASMAQAVPYNAGQTEEQMRLLRQIYENKKKFTPGAGQGQGSEIGNMFSGMSMSD